MKLLTLSGPSGTGKTTLGLQAIGKRGEHVLVPGSSNMSLEELLKEANHHRIGVLFDDVRPADTGVLVALLREVDVSGIPVVVIAGEHVSTNLDSIHIEMRKVS